MADDETPKSSVTPKPASRKATRKPALTKAPAKKPGPRKAAVTKPVAAKAAVAKPAVAKVAAPIKAPEPAPSEPAAEAVASAEPVAAPEPAVEGVATAMETPAAPSAPTPIVTRAEEKPAKAGASPKVAKPKAAPKTASKPTAPAFAGLLTNFMLEDTTMDMSANFTSFQDAIAEAQTKAKEAFEKGTTMMGEASDFTKGNVEAMMESGKIFAEGMQSFGSELVSEGRTAFEAMSGDIKELAAAKSPTDFFKLQGDMVRKNFDSAVATGSKNSEAMLKLMSDAFAPLSGRVSMAMEKARSASAF
ncbi:phasin family protein [Novosphingobium profundi]|uniref:phasin family protein n=1 Tax=Novosphingobium profundi TaxID=1774954 RepID=UPI001BD9D176|nr:phasin family protein [Novosphingobium profundi]MBT0671201.1 phasin family protein [Novosphingobium profundi]